MEEAGRISTVKVFLSVSPSTFGFSLPPPFFHPGKIRTPAMMLYCRRGTPSYLTADFLEKIKEVQVLSLPAHDL